MSGHRVELYVSCTVSSREAAEGVIQQLEHFGGTGWLVGNAADFTVARGTVDGNSWHDRWPPQPRPTPGVYRCGFLIQHSASVFTDKPGAYRVSRDGHANIIGEAFFNEINADTDEAFEEFMSAAIRPDFPRPFMLGAAA